MTLKELQELVKKTEELEGYRENADLLFEYTWICVQLEKGIEDDNYGRDLREEKFKLRYEILKRMGGNE